MKTLILAIFLIVLSSLEVVAQKNSCPYLDKYGNEYVLTWNSETGTSKLYSYSSVNEKFVVADYQLPKIE